MARVLALVPDLLFGSRVQGALQGGGHEVELISEPARVEGRLQDRGLEPAAVLIVDLTSEDLDGPAVVRALTQAGVLEGVRTLGFFSHVDTPARERAEQAGFDLVVPRSRMAREGADLITRLASDAPPARR